MATTGLDYTSKSMSGLQLAGHIIKNGLTKGIGKNVEMGTTAANVLKKNRSIFYTIKSN